MLYKYKKSDWRYWYSTPRRYALIEIDKINSSLRRCIPYCGIYNISIIGKLKRIYACIYDGHKSMAKEIYYNLCTAGENLNLLPPWLYEYYGGGGAEKKIDRTNTFRP
jgi:hypothetical protein